MISVVVNDQHVTAAAIERSGRVLLPFRAIFGALGATVEYRASSGSVIAKRGDRIVVLKTPLTIAGRAYVPVRYVAQNLGAHVDYDAAKHLVTITDRERSVSATVEVTDIFPHQGQTISGAYPVIGATLLAKGTRLESDQLKLTIDGRDVSPYATFDGQRISFTPRAAMQPGLHEIILSGTPTEGASFSKLWQFTTEGSAGTPATSPTPRDANLNEPIAFYVQGGAPFRYYPGQDVHFVLNAPGGGHAVMQLCDVGRIPFINPPGTTQYFVTFEVPQQLYAPYCPVTAFYESPTGSTQAIRLYEPVAFVRAPTPSPSPSPTPGRRTKPPAPRRVQGSPKPP